MDVCVSLLGTTDDRQGIVRWVVVERMRIIEATAFRQTRFLTATMLEAQSIHRLSKGSQTLVPFKNPVCEKLVKNGRFSITMGSRTVRQSLGLEVATMRQSIQMG
jgi:hypothetical protein